MKSYPRLAYSLSQHHFQPALSLSKVDGFLIVSVSFLSPPYCQTPSHICYFFSEQTEECQNV